METFLLLPLLQVDHEINQRARVIVGEVDHEINQSDKIK
jgi:hypothetical protein